LHLVKVLVAQLGGELTFSGAQGTSVAIRFPIEGVLAKFNENVPGTAG
jgi:two-component sensor histidine kinase